MNIFKTFLNKNVFKNITIRRYFIWEIKFISMYNYLINLTEPLIVERNELLKHNKRIEITVENKPNI